MRSLVAGQSSVTAAGDTLGALVDALEADYPGIKARLTEGDRIRRGLAVFVNSAQVSSNLTTKVPPDAEVYFAPAISGG
jgi:molybdopterin converting factor small subunit